MKTIFCLRVIVCVFLVVSSITLLSEKVDVKALQISGSNVLSLVNGVFTYSQDIIIEGNATLFVENATIVFDQTSNNQYGVVLQNPSNGNPRLIAKNSYFESAKSFKVTLRDNSTATLTHVWFQGKAAAKTLELHDSSEMNIFDNCSILYTHAYESASMRAVGSNIFFLYAYDNSNITIKASLINNVNAYDNSTIDVSVSDIKYDVIVSGLSSVSFAHSYFPGRVMCSGASRVLIEHTTLEHSTFRIVDHCNVTVYNATSMPSRDPTNFSVKGFSNLFISKCYFLKTILDVYDNSTINVNDSKLDGVNLRSSGNSTVQISNSSVDWLAECTDNSELSASNSSFQILSGKEFANIVLTQCSVGRLRGYDSTEVMISDSTIAEVAVELSSINRTLSGFAEGFFDQISFIVGNFSAVFTDVQVHGWTLNLLGFSNVTLEDSTLINLNVYGSSRVLLLNSTYVNINVRGQATVTVYSYLKVRVVDYFGAPIEGADVTVSNSSGVVESKLTGEDGVASFMLFERSIDSSYDVPVDYSMSVSFGEYSSSSDLDLSGLQLLVSTIPSPWWYWYMIVGIVVAVVFVLGFGIVWYFKRKRQPT